MSLPEGPGTPASDAAGFLAQATTGCRAIQTMTAAISVRGSIGGRRVRGRLDVGVAAPEAARVEAVAPFGLLFTLVGRGDAATLVLHRDNRVLQGGRPAEVLEAVAGIPLDAAGLRTMLTACVASGDVGAARRLGSDWLVVPDGDDLLYLRRMDDRWRLVAVLHRPPNGQPWRAEYRDFEDRYARSIHLVSEDRRRFDLTLELSQVELDAQLGDAVFQISAPPTATPITIDELRTSGPLASSPSDDDR
jgi:hypothetical protein